MKEKQNWFLGSEKNYYFYIYNREIQTVHTITVSWGWGIWKKKKSHKALWENDNGKKFEKH